MVILFVLTAIAIVFGVHVLSSYMVGGDPFFFFRRRVWLKDCWGEIRPSRLYGTRESYVYPNYRLANLLLHSNGTVSGSVRYIDYWSFNRDELLDKKASYEH